MSRGERKEGIPLTSKFYKIIYKYMINIGELKQKASQPLVVFVFLCIVITTGLLYVMQKSVALGDSLSTRSSDPISELLNN